jgi:pyruvate-formate lyase
MLGGDLNEAAIREVVNQFIAEARDARVMRNDRYNRLTAGAGQWGGGAMVDRDLRLYTAAELRLFEGDPTCLWRYVH